MNSAPTAPQMPAFLQHLAHKWGREHLGFVLALVAYGSWSSMDAIVKHVSQTYPITQIITLTMAIAVSMMLAVLCRSRRDFLDIVPRRPVLQLVRTAFYLGSAFFAFTAFSLIPLAEVYPVIFVAPFIITVLGVVFLREKMTVPHLLALILGFVGVLVVFRPGFQAISLGLWMALFCAISHAVAVVLLRYMAAHESFRANLFFPMIISFFVMGFVSLPHWVPLRAVDYAVFAVIGALSMLGNIALNMAFRLCPAARQAPAQYSQILWGVAYGWLFFADVPQGISLLGTAIIIAAGLLILRDKPKIA